MEAKQTSKNSRWKLWVFVVLGIIAAYFIVITAVDQRLSELQLETKLLIADQEKILATIAETTARNGADAVTESIVRDCSLPERARFDELLGQLDTGLSRANLTELERLFGRCGNFYAQRKSVMVARLAREIEIYEDYVLQLNSLTDLDNTETYKIQKWHELADLEQKQSDLFNELVIKQDEIISALLDGSTATSPDIQNILQEAREVQETLIVLKAQATTVRSDLVSL